MGTTNIWTKISVIAGILCWVSLLSAFLAQLFVTPYATHIVMFGYPIGMALGPISIVAGVVATKQINKSQGAQDGKNLALTGIVIGGISLAPICFLLFVFVVFVFIPTVLFLMGFPQ